MAVMTYTETLETTQCWCGIHLAVPSNLLRTARENHRSIYCPLGHTFVFAESEADKLRKQLEKAESLAARRLAQLDGAQATTRTLERRVAAQKGELTKAKKRAANGVCLCCNRQFVDVLKHMRSKHPEMVIEANMLEASSSDIIEATIVENKRPAELGTGK